MFRLWLEEQKTSKDMTGSSMELKMSFVSPGLFIVALRSIQTN